MISNYASTSFGIVNIFLMLFIFILIEIFYHLTVCTIAIPNCMLGFHFICAKRLETSH